MGTFNLSKHLALVPDSKHAVRTKPDPVRLTDEIAEIRQTIREVIESAEVEGRKIDPSELYEVAVIPLTVPVEPKADQRCKQCGYVTSHAIAFRKFQPLLPTAVCLCAQAREFLACEAFIRHGSSVSRCTKTASRAHRNGANLVCSQHVDEENVIESDLRDMEESA